MTTNLTEIISMSLPFLRNISMSSYHIISLMFMPVVPAILTRNNRHCSGFRNDMSMA